MSNQTERETLKPCPFCGGEAELDTMQPYCDIGTGRPGTAIAVYCCKCTAQVHICRGDVPDIEPEAVIEMWNARAALAAHPPEQENAAAQEALAPDRQACFDYSGSNAPGSASPAPPVAAAPIVAPPEIQGDALGNETERSGEAVQRPSVDTGEPSVDERDSELSLDWRTSDNSILSICIEPNGDAVWAWHIGESHGSGRFHIDDEAYIVLAKAAKEYAPAHEAALNETARSDPQGKGQVEAMPVAPNHWGYEQDFHNASMIAIAEALGEDVKDEPRCKWVALAASNRMAELSRAKAAIRELVKVEALRLKSNGWSTTEEENKYLDDNWGAAWATARAIATKEPK